MDDRALLFRVHAVRTPMTMRCPICHHGDLQPGEVTVTLDRPGPHAVTVVFRGVPAQVCPNCGEEFVDQRVTAELLKLANAVQGEGDSVQVQRYAAA